MITATLKNRLQALEERKNVKRELPWDCKSLMSRYRDERARREIIFKLYELRGDDCLPPEPLRIKVEDQRVLSREAREFLSLSAERQAQAVDYYPLGPPLIEEEREELTREILDKLDKIRAGPWAHTL